MYETKTVEHFSYRPVLKIMAIVQISMKYTL